MKMHQAVLDINAHLIFAKVSLQLPPVAHLQASIYAMVAKSLDGIPAVHKYPNVFLDDLLGMPPDRAWHCPCL
jgi:hypothetical protein